jgi:hypothetical protein
MRLGPYRLWGLAFAAFLLTISAWALAAPYDSSADERDHVYRAYAVADGQIAPEPEPAVRGSGAFVTVPRGLVPQTGDYCLQWRSWLSASCSWSPTADRTPTEVGSGAGRYHPVYYGAVGLPLKLWPGWPGVLLSRILSAAICAALLAGALVSIYRYSRHGLMMAGLLVAATPTALHFFASVNPNGVEIAAAVAFFAAAIPLATGRAQGAPRGLVALVGISALWLSMLRPTGLMFLAVAALALLLPPRRAVLRAMWASVAVRWWGGALIVSSVVSVVWLRVMDGSEVGTTFRDAQPYTGGQAIVNVVIQWGEWTEQAIAYFGWVSIRPPQPVYLIWECAAGALLLLGVVMGGRVERYRLAMLLAGAVAVPTAMQIFFLNDAGWVTQGRYMLPGLAGLVLMAAHIVDERGGAVVNSRGFVRLAVLLLLPIQLFCLVFSMVRWQRGMPSFRGVGVKYLLNPFAGDWHPVVGSITPLACMLVGLIGLAWLSWRMRAVPAEDGPAARAPVATTPAHEQGPEAATPEPSSARPAAPAVGGKADTTALTRA